MIRSEVIECQGYRLKTPGLKKCFGGVLFCPTECRDVSIGRVTPAGVYLQPWFGLSEPAMEEAMKAHLGVDAHAGLVHTVAGTPANGSRAAGVCPRQSAPRTIASTSMTNSSLTRRSMMSSVFGG
jgi:hypothetical protein